MSALDAHIDDLYMLPLNAFTSARSALAKSLTRDEAARVRALAKPTVVAWAVNQVYWRARSAHDRLMKHGARLRTAQIAALEGRAADVRAAADAHRRAIGDAVAEATRLAAAAGAKPDADALARTFEALSLATRAPASPGRLTDALQPAGFEALAGIAPQRAALRVVPGRTHGSAPPRSGGGTTRSGAGAEPRVGPDAKAREAAEAKGAAEDAARAAAERRKHEAAVKVAEAELARVEAAERGAREAWERTHDELLAARQALRDLRRSRFRSS